MEGPIVAHVTVAFPLPGRDVGDTLQTGGALAPVGGVTDAVKAMVPLNPSLAVTVNGN
jgi:hypothetical protein